MTGKRLQTPSSHPGFDRGANVRPLTAPGMDEHLQRNAAWGVLAVLMLATCLYVALALSFNIWRDEVYTLRTTGRGVFGALSAAITFEEQPPLYFGMTAAWRLIVGESLMSLRSFSILVTVAWLCVFWRFVQILGHTPVVALAWLSLAAFHPTVIWMATEARAYALWALLVLASAYLFVLRILRPKAGLHDWLHFALVTLLAMLTHAFTALFIASEFVALVAHRRWRATLWAGCVFACILGLVAPIYLSIYNGSANVITPTATAPAPVAMADEFVSQITETVVPGGQSFLSWHRGPLLLVVGILWLQRGWRWLKTDVGSSLVIVAAGFQLLWYAGILVTGLSWLAAPRYGTAVMPFYLLILAGGLAGLDAGTRSHNARAYALIAVALLAIPTVSRSYVRFQSLEKGGDWVRVARYLEENELPGQPILVFTNEAAYPLRYHYAGVNAIRPVPNELAFESFDPTDFAVSSEAEVAGAFEAYVGKEGVAWLVTDDFRSYRGVDYGRTFVESFVSSRTRTLSAAEFDDSQVRLLQYLPSEVAAADSGGG